MLKKLIFNIFKKQILDSTKQLTYDTKISFVEQKVDIVELKSEFVLSESSKLKVKESGYDFLFEYSKRNAVKNIQEKIKDFMSMQYSKSRVDNEERYCLSLFVCKKKN